MDAALIVPYITARAAELGHKKFTWRHKQVTIEANSTSTISAFKNLYVLIDSPKYVKLASENGLYNFGGENEHEHSGSIEITNDDASNTMVNFIAVIFQDSPSQ